MEGHTLLSTSAMQGILEAVFKKQKAGKRHALCFPLPSLVWSAARCGAQAPPGLAGLKDHMVQEHSQHPSLSAQGPAWPGSQQALSIQVRRGRSQGQ